MFKAGFKQYAAKKQYAARSEIQSDTFKPIFSNRTAGGTCGHVNGNLFLGNINQYVQTILVANILLRLDESFLG